MDPLSITSGVVGLVSSAANITIGFNKLLNQYKNAPASITALFTEHRTMQACLNQFQSFLQQSTPHIQSSSDVLEAAQSVVRDTRKTLDELDAQIRLYIPMTASRPKRLLLRKKIMYMFNEPSLLSLQQRIKTGRDEMMVIMNLWSTNNTGTLVEELTALRSALRQFLLHHRHNNLPEPEETVEPMPLSNPGPDDLSADEGVSDDASSVSGASVLTSITVPVGPTVGQRLQLAIARGQLSGPRGEAIHQRAQTVSTQQAGAVGSGLARAATPAIKTLIRDLGMREAEAGGLSTKESANALQALGKAYQDAGDYAKALEYLHEALTAREVSLGPTDLTTLNNLESIGVVLELQQRPEDALAYYLQALEGRLENPRVGPRHPSTFAIRLRILQVKIQLGNFDEALRECEDLLSLPTCGSESALEIKREIAAIKRAQGHTQESLRQYQAVLDDYETLVSSRSSKLGPNHRLTRAAMVSAEQIRRNINELEIPASTETTDMVDLGIREYHRQLEIARELNGVLHPETLSLMFKLACAYASHEKHENAVGWFQEALGGQERTLGGHHPTTTATVHELARSYLELGNIPPALENFQRALDSRESRLGADHPSTLDTVLAISSIYSSGSYEDTTKALELVRRAVTGFQSRFGPTHSRTLNAQFQLAELHLRNGRREQGLELHEHVLRQRIDTFGEEHHSTLVSKHSLGIFYANESQYDKATRFFSEALIGRERKLGRHHSSTVRSAMQLATVYWNSEAWQDALPYYEWYLESLENCQSEAATEQCGAINNIAHCYSMLENYPEAYSWFHKLMMLYEQSHGPKDEKTIQALERMATMMELAENFAQAIEIYQRVVVAREGRLSRHHKDVLLPVYQLSLCTLRADQKEACIRWTQRFLEAPVDEAAGITELMRFVAMRRLAMIWQNQSLFDDAIQMYQSLLDQAQYVLDDDHWVITSAKEELAAAHSMSINLNVALGDLQEQRDKISRLMDLDKPLAVVMLKRVGDIHLKEHLYHEAVAIYEEVLICLQEIESVEGETRIGRSTSPDREEGEPERLTQLKHSTISSLADAHVELANHMAALSFLALLVESKQDPSFRHGALIRTATAQEAMGNYITALDTWALLLSELERERADGQGLNSAADDFTIPKIERKTASLQLRLGNLQEALRLCRTVLDKFRRLDTLRPVTGKRPALESDDAAGDDDEEDSARSEVLRTLSLMASIRFSSGDLHACLETEKEVAEGYEKLLGPTASPTLESALEVADTCAALERKREANEWYSKALGGYKAKFGENHPQARDVEERLEAAQRRWQTG